MNTQQIKQAIANRMLSEYDQGNNGMVDMKQIASELGIPWSQVENVVGMLHEQGIVRTVIGCHVAHLTPLGIRTLEPSDIGVPKQPPQTVNNHFSGSFNQSAIATTNGYATVSVQNTEVNHYFQQLERAIDQSQNIPSEQKQKWKTDLWEMSKHPALVAALGAILGG
ncbi:hypothetical protein [Halomonas sp. GD1P12]|uniref:hypothetical protein n=1 Tax=Halomonas sp. GD1P12 TaxID=2982691 RepID=UPI0021E3D2FF|nr:hypothetical protein [Halomonas sp. GD1P12]UYF99351.1 hypothetical protein OCT39_14100 [Halomonas sp. GD1P12]